MPKLNAVAEHHIRPDVKILEQLFNTLFSQTERTILCSGAEEPLYLPASETEGLHVIYATLDYFSSALHEISHWCIAGEARRQLPDYGYWYEPDGRTLQQQSLFEKVEVKPQALEWLFTEACGQHFRLSVDNVNQPEMKASESFKQNVHSQVLQYLKHGLPQRATLFLNALLGYFQPDRTVLEADLFTLDALK
jgi:elongation factor P hydroxylase